MGFIPLIQPSPPGWLTLTGSGLGRSNRPNPFCPAHSSLFHSSSLSGEPKSPCRRPAIPATSGALRCRHLGPNACLCVLFLPHQTDLEDSTSPRRSRAGSRSGFAGPCRLWTRHLTGSPPGVCCAVFGWLSGTGGSVPDGCSPCCNAAAGEDFPRPRLVGRAGTASPCQPGMHLGVWWVWFFSSSSAFSSLASVTGHLAMNSCAKLTDLVLWSCYWCKLDVLDSVSCCRAGSVMFMLWLFLCQSTILTEC
jgi:hypothetical protein